MYVKYILKKIDGSSINMQYDNEALQTVVFKND